MNRKRESDDLTNLNETKKNKLHIISDDRETVDRSKLLMTTSGDSNDGLLQRFDTSLTPSSNGSALNERSLLNLAIISKLVNQTVPCNRKRRPRILNNANINAVISLNNTTLAQESVTVNRKKSDLLCVVCSGQAHGYNFDAISCESCKAFFRRNALVSLERLKCRRDDLCEITTETRRRCKSCRLKKCFSVGMRKEWILTEEEKQNKKRRIEENRRLRISNDLNQDNQYQLDEKRISNMSNHETVTSSPHVELYEEKQDQLSSTSNLDILINVQIAYCQCFKLNTTEDSLPLYPLTKKLTAICQILNVKNITALRLINFYKKMREFQLCAEEDKVTLIKYNLPCIFFVHAVLGYDPLLDRYNEDTKHHIDGRDILLSHGLETYSKITKLMTTLRSIVELDQIIVQLALVIMLFCKGFSASQTVEPILTDPLKVFRAQNLYIERLWRFLDDRFGDKTATTIFTKLITQCLVIQIISRDTRSDIVEKVNPYDVSPIMRSIMQLS